MTYKCTAGNSSSYLARSFFDTENDQLSNSFLQFETEEAETNTIVIRSNEDHEDATRAAS
jgi:hypothetical protein